MAQHKLSLLVIILSLFCILGLIEPTHLPQAKAYIEAACRTTRYPSLCLHCLSSFANSTVESPHQFDPNCVVGEPILGPKHKVIHVENVQGAQSNRDHEYQTVKDCLQQINDNVDQLSQSIKELHRLNQNATIDDEFLWHISNVETWTSAALTDASSCLKEFQGHRMSKMKATIKGKVLNVAQVTCNALALFHRYSAKYRAAARAT
ncbi:putative 21 kDa protein [Quillaja saponaria]|uniref:21 kDa protein n=1 Tax=Quillaja saponaria TaxID=32244 RepID=A0AAD7PDI4_QUISA|nr:putative 21 kDa protein [Quillaja saponaria]